MASFLSDNNDFKYIKIKIMKIKNKVVIITGVASGIGAETDYSLALKGAKIVLADLNVEMLNAVVNKINSVGGEALAIKTGVTQETDIINLMDKAVETYDGMHVVIPSAGIINDAFIVSPNKETGKVSQCMTTEQFMSVININLLGTFLTLREASIRMINNNWKGILFTISSINKEGQLGQLNYSSTKSSVALWPKIMVGEFHAKKVKNLRVVGIAPNIWKHLYYLT